MSNCSQKLRAGSDIGPENGLDHTSAVSCDHVVTIPKAALGRQIGRLLPGQEPALTAALHAAFDLEDLPPLG